MLSIKLDGWVVFLLIVIFAFYVIKKMRLKLARVLRDKDKTQQQHIVIQLPNAVTTVSSTTTHTTTDTIAQPSPVHLPPEKIV